MKYKIVLERKKMMNQRIRWLEGLEGERACQRYVFIKRDVTEMCTNR